MECAISSHKFPSFVRLVEFLGKSPPLDTTVAHCSSIGNWLAYSRFYNDEGARGFVLRIEEKICLYSTAEPQDEHGMTIHSKYQDIERLKCIRKNSDWTAIDIFVSTRHGSPIKVCIWPLQYLGQQHSTQKIKYRSKMH